MRTRSLGPDGPPVSTIGYGAMLLSIDGRPDEGQALRVLHGVLDAGVTLIDTADVYSMDASDLGHNERLIARALREWPGNREAIVIATKGGSSHPERTKWQPDGRPEHLREACDASLRALGVESIDLYLLHARDPQVPYEESLDAVAQLQREGKIRLIGISNVGPEEIELARRRVSLQVVQNMLNLFQRSSISSSSTGRSIVGTCAAHGLTFVAHSPMGSWWNVSLEQHPVLQPIARRHGVSAHVIALAWVQAQGENVIPIPGARGPEHAVEALRAADVELTPDDLRAMDRAEFPRD